MIFLKNMFFLSAIYVESLFLFLFFIYPVLVFKIFLKRNVFNYIVNWENISDFFFFLFVTF